MLEGREDMVDYRANIRPGRIACAHEGPTSDFSYARRPFLHRRRDRITTSKLAHFEVRYLDTNVILHRRASNKQGQRRDAPAAAATAVRVNIACVKDDPNFARRAEMKKLWEPDNGSLGRK